MKYAIRGPPRGRVVALMVTSCLFLSTIPSPLCLGT